MDFPDLLRLIDERSAAFRAAVASAPSLDAPVPTCPGWTLADLVQHLGVRRYSWAATIAAGPGATARAPEEVAPPMPQDRESQVAWLAWSTQAQLDALREAGPDRGVWSWWDEAQAPHTCGVLARHQLQEIAVHTYDAQLTVGAAEPLPEAVALDGVEDFLLTVVATTVPWPHTPAVIDYHLNEGRSWRLLLSGEGIRVVQLENPAEAGPAGFSARGAASDLVLWFYDRLPMETLRVEGDQGVLNQLIAWDPSA